jgi:predicted nucleic acid-binding Zn ribbon protein
MREALSRSVPATPLAALQSAWLGAVGDRIAAVARPVSEVDGEVVVECADPVWAQELDLMQEKLLASLRERLGERAPSGLRFRVGELED